MPSASDELQNTIRKWFGCIDDYMPSKFLLARGWTEHRGLWTKPTESYNPSCYETTCLVFLRDEWDHDWNQQFFTPMVIETPNVKES